MTKNSAYNILGLSKAASKAEVKAAYKELSLKNHPDKNNNSKESAEKFIEIRAAYEFILDDLNNKKKSDDFTSDSQADEDDSFWEPYFKSEDFKIFKAKFTKDYKSETDIITKNYKSETDTITKNYKSEADTIIYTKTINYNLIEDEFLTGLTLDSH